jgi:hypothetical protein
MGGWVFERKSIRGKGKGKSAAGRLNLVEKICHTPHKQFLFNMMRDPTTKICWKLGHYLDIPRSTIFNSDNIFRPCAKVGGRKRPECLSKKYLEQNV